MVVDVTTTHDNSWLMEVESPGQPQDVPIRPSFKDVVHESNKFFPTVSTLMEQLQEDLEEPIDEPDTPLKVSFTPEQLRLLRAP